MFFIKFAAVLFWKFLANKFRYFVYVIGCLNAAGTLPKTRLANMRKEYALLPAKAVNDNRFFLSAFAQLNQPFGGLIKPVTF